MDSPSLHPEQLAKLAKIARKYESFLSKLTGRIHQTHFPHNDPLRVAANKAYEAAVELNKVIAALEKAKRPDISMARQITPIAKASEI